MLFRGGARRITTRKILCTVITVSASSGEAPHVVECPNSRRVLSATTDQFRCPVLVCRFMKVMNIDDVRRQFGEHRIQSLMNPSLIQNSAIAFGEETPENLSTEPIGRQRQAPCLPGMFLP